MKTINYDNVLFETVKTRLPKDINPVWFIMYTLSISKEAVYRRLRGDVALTLKEAALLSKELGISLDEIVYPDSNKTYYYKNIRVNFDTPDEDDYKVLWAYLDNICRRYDDPDSQLAVTANAFPQQLFLRYRNISKFALFKWIYQEGESQPKAYHEVKVSERMQKIFRVSCEAHMQLRATYYILDHQLTHSLVNDMKYFISVGMLKPEDAESIRDDTHKLLDYMEDIAETGRYENGKEVYIYVSDIDFRESYYNLKARDYYISAIENCVLNNMVCTEKNCYEEVNAWIHSRRRFSTLISQSGELQRIAFFNEQRTMLDSL